MSELFRSPTPFSVVDCNTRLSLGLFLFLVLSSSWQGSHISGITNISGSLMKSGFTLQSQVHTVASGLPYRDAPYIYVLLVSGLSVDLLVSDNCVCPVSPPWFLGLGLLLWILAPDLPRSSSLTYPLSILFPQTLFRASFGMVTAAQASWPPLTSSPLGLVVLLNPMYVCTVCMYLWICACEFGAF